MPLAALLCFHFAPCAVQAAEANPLDIADAKAKTEAEMKPYRDVIANTDVTFEMLPIKGGKFTIGSPDAEEGRNADEGPQKEVAVAPFWMGKHEVTWDEYEVFMFALDHQRRHVIKIEASEQRQARRRHRPPHQALHRHDLWHGQEGLSGDLA